jgi:hypothetical protein
MSGRKGRSGRKPLSANEALMRGCYRPERHGALPENVIAMPTPTTLGQGGIEGWSPSRADLSTLGQKGKGFVKQWVDVHVCNLREGVIVMAAARALDEAARWTKRSHGKGPHQARSARLALGFEKQHTALVSQLRVTL